MNDVTCSDCGKQTQVPFRPTAGRPVYCRDCFGKHAPPRGESRGGGGGGFGGGRGGDRGPRGGGSDREMHDTTCSDCGTETQVPFRPTEGRPVYCRDCFSKHAPPRDSRGPRRF